MLQQKTSKRKMHKWSYEDKTKEWTDEGWGTAEEDVNHEFGIVVVTMRDDRGRCNAIAEVIDSVYVASSRLLIVDLSADGHR